MSMKKRAEISKVVLIIGLIAVLIVGVVLVAMILKSKFGDKGADANGNNESIGGTLDESSDPGLIVPEDEQNPGAPAPDLSDLP